MTKKYVILSTERPSNYEDRHPQETVYGPGHPIHEIMRAISGLPGPYDQNDPELLQVRYDELLAILEDNIGKTA